MDHAGKRSTTSGISALQRVAEPSLGPGKRTLTEQLTPVQRVQQISTGHAPSGEQVHVAAVRGIQGSASSLPFADQIQASFGSHDIRGIQAHVGGSAAEATSAMGATAYATGNHTVFSGAPDLHTAAHEAAHVVQQRAGVHLKGGVGEVGDPHEQHADAVADKVVRGESAEGLLDAYGGGGGGKQPAAGTAGHGPDPAGAARVPVLGGGATDAEDKPAAMPPEDSVQLITHTATGQAPVTIDINTLDDDGCRQHLQRIGRIKAGHPVGNDSEYTYAPDDQALLKARQATLLEGRRITLVNALVAQLGALATAADHQVQPPWNGHNPASGGDNEVSGASVQPVEATIVAAWAGFLGAGPYSHKHPRTGAVDNTRLVSADGQRSIRYGNHERTSTAANHHFHQETWNYDPTANTVTVANTMRRASVK